MSLKHNDWQGQETVTGIRHGTWQSYRERERERNDGKTEDMKEGEGPFGEKRRSCKNENGNVGGTQGQKWSDNACVADM